MAVPFRRTSKTAKRMRRTHFKLSVSGLVKCPNCGAMIKSHNVCPKCGYYNGKAVVTKKAEKKEESK
jgi:large subunit ribosomal protein L32